MRDYNKYNPKLAVHPLGKHNPGLDIIHGKLDVKIDGKPSVIIDRPARGFDGGTRAVQPSGTQAASSRLAVAAKPAATAASPTTRLPRL